MAQPRARSRIRATHQRKRAVLAADYGVVWQTIEDIQPCRSDRFFQRPSTGNCQHDERDHSFNAGDRWKRNHQLSRNSDLEAAATGASSFEGSPAIGTPLPATSVRTIPDQQPDRELGCLLARHALAHLSLRRHTHRARAVPHNTAHCRWGRSYQRNRHDQPKTAASSTPLCVPRSNWNINGTVEMLYADNAFTPVSPRQTQHYRVHTMYRPKPWATVSGAYNDLERHNNTNNNQSATWQQATRSLRGSARPCRSQPGREPGRSVLPNEHLWVRFQLRLQRCLYGDQYLL